MVLRPLWQRLFSKAPILANPTVRRIAGYASWIPVLGIFNAHVAELTSISGPSMYPLLNTDKDGTLRRDVVVNVKYGAERNLQRGMVVTLRCVGPCGNISHAGRRKSHSRTDWDDRSPFHPEIVAVKRVVGLPGDLVETKPPYPLETVRIPPRHVWVEGDGPPGSSLDSNTYGPVSTRMVVGKVTHIVYPFSKFGPIDWQA